MVSYRAIAADAPQPTQPFNPWANNSQQTTHQVTQVHHLPRRSSSSTRSKRTPTPTPARAHKHQQSTPAPIRASKHIPSPSTQPKRDGEVLLREQPLRIQALLVHGAKPSLARLFPRQITTRKCLPLERERSPLQIGFTPRHGYYWIGGREAHRPGQVLHPLRRTPFKRISAEPLYLPTKKTTAAATACKPSKPSKQSFSSTIMPGLAESSKRSSHRSSRRVSSRRKEDEAAVSDAWRCRLSESSRAYDEFQAAMKEAEKRMLEQERLASRSIKDKVYDAVYYWMVENIAKPLGLKVD